MLRSNLSSRPFYNERAVHLVLALAALVILAVTVLNLVEVVRLSRENTALSAGSRDDRTLAEDFARKARATRQGINQNELKLVVTAAREANTLIDSRTFSWTELFNFLESTLPPDVMLTSVRPTIDEKGTKITMTIVARRRDDATEFMDKLEATGAFEDILPRQDSVNDEGLTQVTVDAIYVPALAEPKTGTGTGGTR